MRANTLACTNKTSLSPPPLNTLESNTHLLIPLISILNTQVKIIVRSTLLYLFLRMRRKHRCFDVVVAVVVVVVVVVMVLVAF